jgi:signal transduction histidine kinase
MGNLVANALKFTPSGGKIEIGARRITEGIEIWVKDSGIGIAPGEIQTLFSKYQQTASGQKSNEEGTGLGLLICKMIAESHGGRIWVESQLNKGTAFFVWLPSAAESYRPTGT